MTAVDRRRDERATSTTLDVVLCLLLVSAAVGVLAAASPPPEGHDPRTADRAIAILSTTTVAVDHEPAAVAASDVPADDVGPRRVHGTLAALLARAAVADFAVDRTERTASRGAFEGAVANRTRAAFASVDASVNVTASYAPLPGSGANGEASAGPAVPRDVDVAVARLRVPVGTGPNAALLRRAATEDGVSGVASAVADATLSTVLPPSRTRWQLRDSATKSTVVSRYRRLGRALDASTTDALADGRVRRANARLSRALADRYVVVARDEYETADDAAGAARPRVVVLTVRTWSP
jgi:hypothetical protein